MTRLFDVDDYPEETPREPRTTPERLYEIKEPGTWEMIFDKEAVEHLDRLKEHMPRAKGREEVVYTALQILALSVNRDVIIEGKFNGSPKKVSRLWKP